jgi:hypothetical protein
MVVRPVPRGLKSGLVQRKAASGVGEGPARAKAIGCWSQIFLITDAIARRILLTVTLPYRLTAAQRVSKGRSTENLDVIRHRLGIWRCSDRLSAGGAGARVTVPEKGHRCSPTECPRAPDPWLFRHSGSRRLTIRQVGNISIARDHLNLPCKARQTARYWRRR